MTAPLQLELLADNPSPLFGLAITMPEPCSRCHGTRATVGTGRGPHTASLMCARGRHLGWMSREAFDFLTATVSRFGRPTTPILIRRARGASSASSDADARCPQPASKLEK
jgi:hypothetical protein